MDSKMFSLKTDSSSIKMVFNPTSNPSPPVCVSQFINKGMVTRYLCINIRWNIPDFLQGNYAKIEGISGYVSNKIP